MTDHTDLVRVASPAPLAPEGLFMPVHHCPGGPQP